MLSHVLLNHAFEWFYMYAYMYSASTIITKSYHCDKYTTSEHDIELATVRVTKDVKQYWSGVLSTS